MKRLRNWCAAGLVLLVLIFSFGRSTIFKTLPKDLSDQNSQVFSVSSNTNKGGFWRKNRSVSSTRVLPSAGSTINANSTSIQRHFPNAHILDSRIEQLTENEFLRTLLIETQLKYPFIRLETRFRQDGPDEIILGKNEVVADHVSVQLQPEATEEDLIALIALVNGSILKKLNLEYAQTYLIRLPELTLDAVPNAIKRLSAATNVVLDVDGDAVSRKTFVPNDPQFSDAWHLKNTGQSGGLVDADIDATEAWAISTGSPYVLVATSDTGVDFEHPDLRANIWTNINERVNSIDDDNNSYRDDVRGWNFYSGNNNVKDRDGHGTHVAGVIGAVGNNGIGVSGVAWNCKIVPLRTLDTEGGFNSDIAEGFDYARRLGVKIINASHGGGTSAALKRAVDNLEFAGVLLVVAAGNDGEDIDQLPLYPASYPNANVIAVAGTARSDDLYTSSSFGVVNVDLAAPGAGILSTAIGNRYSVMSGTSFAAPQVAGVAALLKAQNPALDCFQIRARILATVDKLPTLSGKCVTGGRLNAYKALLPRVNLATALDGASLTWTTAGSAPWIGGKAFSYDGVDSAETGKIWHNQESSLQTTVTGPGTISFRWKISSEPVADFLGFYVDGELKTKISGEMNWSARTINIGAGIKTLTWKYSKDSSVNGGDDKGFVDAVHFVPDPPTITSQPINKSAYLGSVATFEVSATGPGPLTYQWRKNGTDIAGATKSVVTFVNLKPSHAGNYSVLVRNPGGTASSRQATLTLCSLTLTPGSLNFGYEGGMSEIAVSLAGPCSWFVENTNDWIISSAPGLDSLHLTVAENQSRFARAGLIAAGNRNLLVTQLGVPAPEGLSARTFAMFVTNSTEALYTNSSFLLTTSVAENINKFDLRPLDEFSTADTGTFSYARTASDSALLVLSSSITNEVELTFSSISGGTFVMDTPSGATQSGYFNTQPKRATFGDNLYNDILWIGPQRQLVAWHMQGTELLGTSSLGNNQPVPLNWRVVAPADLFGRNDTDILLQHTNRHLTAWMFSNGTNYLNSVSLRSGIPAGAGWKAASTGDFNDDGKLDVVFQHQDTRSAIWFMNGVDLLGSHLLRDGFVAGSGWNIVGVADFNGDGASDLLWQHRDGRLQVWSFIGTQFIGSTALRNSGRGWRVVAIQDFNNDAKNDLLFLHADRRLAVWFLDGTTFLKSELLRNGQPVPSGWKVAGPR